MGKEGPSATNLEDGYRGLKICSHFKYLPAVSIMKHTNPCGVAIGLGGRSTEEVFEDAWSSDPGAAYGSVVCFNTTVTEQAVEHFKERVGDHFKDRFIECLFAPGYEDKALETLSTRKGLRIAKVPEIGKIGNVCFPYEMKILGDAVLVEDQYHTNITSVDELKKKTVATKRQPTELEWEQLWYAWIVCTNKRSNGVVFWKDNKILAVGTGQQDRIGAIKIARSRIDRIGHDLNGSVMASDGFMLPDNVEPLVIKKDEKIVGKVAAVVQPGGSIFDKEVTEQGDKYDMVMVLTGERCFRHF